MLDACRRNQRDQSLAGSGVSIRHVTAFGSSTTLHLLMLAAAVWLASAAPRRPTLMGHSAKVIAVLVPAQTEDSEFPGLNPMIRTDDDVALRQGDESSAFSVGSFIFDFANIERA